MVNLVTVKDRELMKVGKYQLSTGEFECTPELIQAAISAHEAGVLRKPVARIGHNDPRFSGDPAVGWFDNLRASADGTTLYADHHGVPQWLADNLPSAYPSLSIEGMYNYMAPDGTAYEFILTGVGLLGATDPGIGTLKSIQDLESLYTSDALVDIAAAAGLGGTAVSFTVEAADKPYGDVTYADPKNGKYPINTKEHVKAAWSYINMPKNQQGYSSEELAQIKSRIKSAAKKFGITIEASSASEIEKGAVMASLQEKMAEKLGLAPDADEDAILEAFTQATDKPVEDEQEAPAEPVEQPQPIAASAPNIVNLQKDQYDVLMAAAAEVHKIRAEQAAENREKLVMAAVKDGRITPASRADWLKALEVDPGGHNQAALASLKPGFVPVSEMGHGNVSAEGAEPATSGDGDAQVKNYAQSRIFAALGIPSAKEN